MGKKKEKSTESKKTDTVAKGGQNEKPETRGTGNTTIPGVKTGTGDTMPGKNKKAIAGAIVAIAIGAVGLVGSNMQSGSSPEAEVKNASPAAVVQQQPVRATSEAAAASMIPQPLAPQKVQLAEPAKATHELAKPSKESAKKSAKVAKKATKDSVKKAVVSNHKQKAVKPEKKAKKTLASKTND